MNVTDAAHAIGLDLAADEVTGTIDEESVLGALAELGRDDPDNGDLVDEATARVRRSRSAGVEDLGIADRLVARQRETSTIQLRYRSEMVDVFSDLAIDIGLRRHRPEPSIA